MMTMSTAGKEESTAFESLDRFQVTERNFGACAGLKSIFTIVTVSMSISLIDIRFAISVCLTFAQEQTDIENMRVFILSV